MLGLLPILFVGGDLAGNQLSPAGPVWPLSVSPGMISNWLYGDPPRVLPGATIAPEKREEINSHLERTSGNRTFIQRNPVQYPEAYAVKSTGMRGHTQDPIYS